MSEFGAMAANSWLLSVIFDSRDSKEERTVDLPPPYLSAATREPPSSPRAVKRKRASARVPVRASAVVLANTSDKEVAGTGEEEEG
eukprot:CAMPEP_0114495412 /NCGR_PEP_ID=MMETSP0109-20121206/5198_1 /TAXON_ID=29199 /ORGANISM="Chlorarachnion reptans, Strain CCCM449" /LENGTH=85 /DNA_ID=CAMNT_0001672567 /DNA_START=507 /DNA_END=761 /DNA_ORIENTATION=+